MKKGLIFSAAVVLVVACNNEPVKTEKTKTLGLAMADLDTTVSPCDNFFGFVSGGWVENHPIPPTEARWGNFNILVEENNKKVWGILDSLNKVEGLEKGSYQQLVGDFYKSAMDSLAVEKAGLQPLQPVLEKIAAVKTPGDFYDLMVYFKMNGLRSPIASGVDIDDKNSGSYIFSIYQSGLGLPDRDYYLNEDSASVELQGKYREHIAKMLILAGTEEGKAAGEAAEIYAFEKALAEKQMSRVDRREPENVYNKRSRQQLVEAGKDIGMENYLNSLEISFDSAIVAQPAYLGALNEILPATPVETLKAYARWHAVDGMVDYLPHAFVKQNFEFYGKEMNGSKQLKPRWRRTLDNINNGLGEQLGHLFVDRYFSEGSKQRVEQMVEDLRSAYRERILALEWMSDSTKEKALEKLKAFNYKIGYPDKWKDYSDLEIEKDNYLGNGMRLSAYLVRENLDRLGKPVDKEEWFMPPHIVNAYYSSSFNEIVFPAGILQPPFYNPDADDAVNYGAIGGVIGHEFTHGFDDQGRKYNAFGNLANWWGQRDIERFEKRTNKMVVQYSDYQPLKETFVNGKLTLGENIADLGGLTLAYYAYKGSHANGDEEPPVIEGFTWQQRIFLGWGGVWQTSQTDQYTRKQLLTDPHSPAQYRVNGPMSNMPEFREAWGCSAGDAMVRPDSLRVMIW